MRNRTHHLRVAGCQLLIACSLPLAAGNLPSRTKVVTGVAGIALAASRTLAAKTTGATAPQAVATAAGAGPLALNLGLAGFSNPAAGDDDLWCLDKDLVRSAGPQERRTLFPRVHAALLAYEPQVLSTTGCAYEYDGGRISSSLQAGLEARSPEALEARLKQALASTSAYVAHLGRAMELVKELDSYVQYILNKFLVSSDPARGRILRDQILETHKVGLALEAEVAYNRLLKQQLELQVAGVLPSAEAEEDRWRDAHAVAGLDQPCGMMRRGLDRFTRTVLPVLLELWPEPAAPKAAKAGGGSR